MRVEDFEVQDRAAGPWVYLLSSFLFIALLAILPLDPDGNGTAFAWVMIGLMVIVGLWLPLAFARMNPTVRLSTVIGATNAEKLLCIPALLVGLVGLVLGLLGDRAWLMLLAVGLFLCLLPLIARTLILRPPQKGQLATLAPLDTCLYRGVPPSLGLISVVGAVLISRRGGSLPAIIALLIAALWWWALFVLLARRPDRQSMHQPTPSDPGLRPGWLDAAQSVPLLVWPLVLVMLLFGGLPGSIAGQFALSDNVATSTT